MKPPWPRCISEGFADGFPELFFTGENAVFIARTGAAEKQRDFFLVAQNVEHAIEVLKVVIQVDLSGLIVSRDDSAIWLEDELADA